MRPDLSSVGSFFHNYINQVTEDDIVTAFQKHSEELLQCLDAIPPEKYDYRYAEGKWSIKEVLQHIIDAERVFAYRALCFARKDPTPLPGFDENLFAQNAKTEKRDWQNLLEEFKATRKSSEYLFRSFDEDQLMAKGIANNTPNYVLAVGYILIGHSIHHMKILKERYLNT
jgi:uncharacterized damage-inducible protein DinB